MKIKLLFIYILFFVTLIPIPLPWVDGSYNKVSGLYWCSDESACIHEIGHKLDDEAGWVSHTNEFALTVSAFTWYELAEKDVPHPFVYKIMSFRGVFRASPFWIDDNAELYASIFEWSQGKKENMPEIFHRFYDFDRAQELIGELR